jgi:hypothetical protein
MSTLLLSYWGWRRFPRDLSTYELQQFFSLSTQDRYALRRRFRNRSRLGAAVQLGFVRMTGSTQEQCDQYREPYLTSSADSCDNRRRILSLYARYIVADRRCSNINHGRVPMPMRDSAGQHLPIWLLLPTGN